MAETDRLDERPDVRAGHELSDLPPKNIAIFGLVLLVVIILAVAVTYFMDIGFKAAQRRREPPQSPLSFAPQTPPEPRLIVDPGADINGMREAEKSILTTYGWVDRDKGIARIPISEAIDMLAEKGLPARQGGSEKK
ncbi:MAG TPA: hypothetical protein VIB79_20485 [Candidatus Binatia bacterium]|jgi:hypothetical protein